MIRSKSSTPCPKNNYLMCRRARILIILCILFSGIPACHASPVTIAVYPQVCEVGEKILLQGTTTLENTIAVYLFLIGPELDTRGVTLENLNLPAGHGYFTSAHVTNDGSWAYEWNTEFIAGRLKPGTYTIYVANVPLGMDRIPEDDTGSVNVTFIEVPKTASLSMPYAAAAILALAAAAFIATKRG